MKKNGKRPLFSVIIPVFNKAGYVKEALDSVFSQTVKDLEVLVVNDGSTDGTEGVLRSYLNRVRYFYQENRGVSSARNRAITAARGKYLAFLDADDIWLPQKLEQQLSLLERREVIVHSDVEFIDAEGRKISKVAPQICFQQGNLFSGILLWQSRVILSSVVLPRSLSRKAGWFDEELRTAEDTCYLLNLARTGEFKFAPEKLILKRDLPAGLTQTGYESFKKNGTFVCVEKVFKKFPEAGGRLKHKALEKRYFHYGFACFKRGDFPLTRRSMLQVLKYNKFRLKAYVFIGLSLLPFWIKSRLYPQGHVKTGKISSSVI